MDDKAVYRQKRPPTGPRGARVAATQWAMASQTAGTSPLGKADVPVFFDNILITSRRDTLKQDNTMVTGSYKNQRFNTGRYTLTR